LSRKIKIFHLFLLLFTLLLLVHCGKDPKEESYQPAIDFSLPDLTNKMHSMVEFKGQIVVLNFWATWCPPCLEEVPKLNNLYNKYKIRGVQMIGMAMDKDSLNLLDQFVKRNNVSYLILKSNEQVIANLSAGPLGKNFRGVPTTVILDKRGQIYKRFDGSFDSEQLEESLQALINQK
jgi:peroxiredoxin